MALSAGPADAGWARGAGIYGIVAAVVLGGVTIAIIVEDDEDFGIPVGSVGVVFAAISGPIIAAGAGSARDNPAVRGSRGLRTAAWVAYAVTIVDAGILIGIAANDGHVPQAAVASVGMLGVLSMASFAGDAFISASEAESLGGGGGLSIVPGLASMDGRTLVPTLSLRGEL